MSVWHRAGAVMHLRIDSKDDLDLDRICKMCTALVIRH
jgi:hypothetical protein